MKLFDRLKQDGCHQLIHDLSFNRHQTTRDDIAHFCEHDGIYISFTRARSTWHALAPCALKPWWLFLNPLRRKTKNEKENNKNNKNKIIKNTDIEVTENA